MRLDLRVTPADRSLADFNAEFPLGVTSSVAAVDLQGRYAGLISVADAHLATAGSPAAPMPLAQLFRASKTVLRPELNIKEAADLFERSESEALVVVDDLVSLKPIGSLTEAHVLRRYTEELERARSDLAGERWQGEG